MPEEKQRVWVNPQTADVVSSCECPGAGYKFEDALSPEEVIEFREKVDALSAEIVEPEFRHELTFTEAKKLALKQLGLGEDFIDNFTTSPGMLLTLVRGELIAQGRLRRVEKIKVIHPQAGILCAG